MAKIVTLKSPSAEDIYPVTDASGIRVTGNVTLQQALDGFVYADDPTSSVSPEAWITSNDIDWSNIGFKIIAAGTINVGNVSANTNKNGTVNIPTQPDTNYVVIFSHAADVSSYDHCMPTSRLKTVSSFQWYVWNNASSQSGSIKLDYLVVKIVS